MVFLAGLIIGTIIGFIGCALCIANSEAERSMKDVHRDGG